ERWTVVGAEEVDVFLGGAEAEDRRAAVAGHGGGDMTKERVEVVFIAPADGRLQAERGWEVAREDSEGLADEPVGGPARQRDAPAGTADPGQLGRGPAVVGGEHDAVDRDHGVERGVGKGKVFCVALDEPNVKMLGCSAGATALEQRRDIVDADDLAA